MKSQIGRPEIVQNWRWNPIFYYSWGFVIKVDSVDHLNLVNPFPKPHKLTAQFRVSGVTSTGVLVWREDADWFLDSFHCNVVRTSDQYQ